MNSPSLILRPQMPDTIEEARSTYLRARRSLLDEDFDDLMTEWITETAGAEQADAWGIPDTSLNPIASHTRQLVTPGLYGRTPTIYAPPGGEELTGADGFLDKAGIFRRNMGLQYLTVGMGVFLRRINAVDVGYGTQIVDRLVDPANVYVLVDEAEPMRPMVLWELRVQHRKGPDGERIESFYAWHKFDISNSEAPSFRIFRTDKAGTEGEDVTAEFAKDYTNADGSYPWLDPEGRPFLPYIVYRAVDTGVFWPMYRRGMHRGTLRACAHWTYTSRAALFATGEHIILTGIEALPNTTVRHGEGNRELVRPPTESMMVHPGMISLAKKTQGETVDQIKIGPGVNLPYLSDFSNMYGMMLAVADGLHPTDATRQSANPTSGAALAISAESRREYSVQVQPFFRASDLETIQKAAWCLRRLNVNVPDTGYSITYHTIPLSPTEQEDLRADLEWQEERGQVSPVDVHLRLYPGKTPEQAREAVIRARVEAASIEDEVRKRIAAAGIEAPKPPAEHLENDPTVIEDKDPEDPDNETEPKPGAPTAKDPTNFQPKD